MKKMCGGTRSLTCFRRITLAFPYNMKFWCRTSEVNSEISTGVVEISEVNVEVSTAEEEREASERVHCENLADTATLSLSECPKTRCPKTRCPKTRCPKTPGKNKKRKNKKSKINGIRNPAFETNGSLFPESNDDPVSHPECWDCWNYQHKWNHSEEFPYGDGDITYCDSHGLGKYNCDSHGLGKYNCDSHGLGKYKPDFICGEVEGEQFIRDEFEKMRHKYKLETDECVEIFRKAILDHLVTIVKNQKRKSHLYFKRIGVSHGALNQLKTLSS
uniref:Uncharacterized protein n=1 Tax=Lobelia puberula TaxID=113203 RepID=A0A291EZU3_LOBPU|nr:hypothetical protein Lo_pub1Pt0114 [Lobelia puberula]ATG25387.1 hypothetical protein Lo_pub1Pt0114 [Lobelia puberula]